ncbi:MAG TPA: LapA family protein [Candidatus Krumholzibacteria bacterium]|nr:LapA family protein [Candidatus Krumholzibacteria bacterium]HPD71566.1 LapA family protein [Candidatus Krumholzibacteria bacterium]HRY41501.1 LapA family protein [Candidatus Krumholzibacteria bacterium]
MKIVRLFFYLLLVFLVVYLFAANADQSVDLQFFGREYLGVGLYWVVTGSFGLGFLIALGLMGLREVRQRREVGRLRRHNDRINQELAELRALPLQDLASPTSTKDD